MCVMVNAAFRISVIQRKPSQTTENPRLIQPPKTNNTDLTTYVACKIILPGQHLLRVYVQLKLTRNTTYSAPITWNHRDHLRFPNNSSLTGQWPHPRTIVTNSIRRYKRWTNHRWRDGNTFFSPPSKYSDWMTSCGVLKATSHRLSLLLRQRPS